MTKLARNASHSTWNILLFLFRHRRPLWAGPLGLLFPTLPPHPFLLRDGDGMNAYNAWLVKGQLKADDTSSACIRVQVFVCARSFQSDSYLDDAHDMETLIRGYSLILCKPHMHAAGTSAGVRQHRQSWCNRVSLDQPGLWPPTF